MELIETDDGDAGSPRIVFDSSSNAIAVWVQDDSTADSIFANRYIAGIGWESAGLIESDDGDAGSPQIAFDSSGNAIAVWRQKDSATATQYSIFANRYTAETEEWEGPELLETIDTSDAEDPQIGVDSSGNAIAVWRQYDGTRYNIWANRYE